MVRIALGLMSRTSRLMSTALMLWVRSPTEITSTPVSAIGTMVFSLMPPEASVIARLSTSFNPALISSRIHVVEHDHFDPAIEGFLNHVQRLAFNLELKGVLGVRPQRLHSIANAAGDLNMIVFH